MDKLLFKKVFNPFKAEAINGGKKYQIITSYRVLQCQVGTYTSRHLESNSERIFRQI